MQTFAAVDIGSNSCRLKIARVVQHSLRVVHEDREVTRLGASVFESGLVSPESMAATLSALKRFLPGGAVAWGRPGPRRGHRCHARRPQWTRLSSLGERRDWLGGRNYLRPGGSPTDSSRSDRERIRHLRTLPAHRCWRRKLRDLPVRAQAPPGDQSAFPLAPCG